MTGPPPERHDPSPPARLLASMPSPTWPTQLERLAGDLGIVAMGSRGRLQHERHVRAGRPG